MLVLFSFFKYFVERGLVPADLVTKEYDQVSYSFTYLVIKQCLEILMLI